ncbi:MAG TPA: methyltransferase domain-containing protein [Acidobacteriota bacterium]|jgi:ubiquinone/menaquinone biosynthesis C-methylase UbiE
MDEHILTLICDPETHEALEFHPEALVNVRSGRRYLIREGIPDFIDIVSGRNKKYQELYDHIAWLYDPAENLYRWFKRRHDFRRDYIDELEVPSGARVLEVSVGTGANLPYFSSGVEFFGLDLSWGMLRRCRKNLHKWNRTAELFRGEGERLPFHANIFDVVFHVGGINFFNDKARAIQEMIRVAKPGTKIVIVDETEKVVKQLYERIPLLNKYFRKRIEAVADPRHLVPGNMREVKCKEFAGGRLYCVTFRKP